jgi:RHS repeat-associated protein
MATMRTRSLAWALNGSVVHASASGKIVNITAASNGSNTNYSLSAGSQSNEQMSSFSATASGPSLTGGTDNQYVPNPPVYSLTSVSYAPDSDLLSANDQSNKVWDYSYNDLNQLTQACTPTCSGTVLNYGYDRYGNRWTAPTANATFTQNNNRMDGWSYDPDGNLLSDGTHSYSYDAENRLTAVDGGTTASYVYDAEGRRVHENVGGVVKEYVYGSEGQELTVVDGSQNLIQGETYFDGRLLGTQEPSGFVWAHADELGTVRKRTNSSASSLETDTSWPFGAHLNAVGSYSNLHFTGKYRDGESGLDYFGARYYSSALGRFTTPDWSAAPEPVPYARLDDPQSLNLYSYVSIGQPLRWMRTGIAARFAGG